mgnify:CR=1 FL=1
MGTYRLYEVELFFFFQAEDGIRDLVRSRGLGDVYKRQLPLYATGESRRAVAAGAPGKRPDPLGFVIGVYNICLLYTSDAADERSSVDLGGRRIIKKNTTRHILNATSITYLHQKAARPERTVSTYSRKGNN